MNKKKSQNLTFVFSLGCVDWNYEFDKCLKSLESRNKKG